MAQFYMTATGSRESGLSVHARGWNIGARVELKHVDGKDHVYIYKTSGSHTKHSDFLIVDTVDTIEQEREERNFNIIENIESFLFCNVK